MLTGTEIKSLRNGRANIGDAFATIRNGEIHIHNMHISPFEQGNRANPTDPTRTRKLLMHKEQIHKLLGLSKRDGFTIVPLKVYVRNGYAKLLIGLGKGKKSTINVTLLLSVMLSVISSVYCVRSKRSPDNLGRMYDSNEYQFPPSIPLTYVLKY